MPPYLEPTEAAARAFLARGISGPVVMLNLLRFRETADYSAHPQLAPGAPITGADAYDLYVAHTEPFLAASGGRVIFDGAAGPWLIGPADEHWDRALLIEQASARGFLSFAQDTDYLAGLGHRTAALADSRLLPLAPGL